MISLYQKTWTEINNDIAQKIVRLRKRKKITQKQLAVRSGVSLGSLKRFEQSGEISLQSLTKIAIALMWRTNLKTCLIMCLLRLSRR